MMSKAELARKANISPVTITRIESGLSCRMETKRKIILALGLKMSDKNKVFGEDVELSIKDKEDGGGPKKLDNVLSSESA